MQLAVTKVYINKYTVEYASKMKILIITLNAYLPYINTDNA